MPSQSMLEWAMFFFGATGSFLVALQIRISGWGFVSYLLANFCMLGVAFYMRSLPVLLMQLVYMVSSILGIYRAFFMKRPVIKVKP